MKPDSTTPLGLATVQKNDFVLIPSCCVGSKSLEGDNETFDEKIKRLTAQVSQHVAECSRLVKLIQDKLEPLEFEFER